MDAREPGVNPAPETVMVSPPANPLHTGAVGLESLHDAPAALTLRESVGVAPDAPVTSVPNSTPPATTARTPTDANNLEVRLRRSTFPPQSDRWGGADRPRPTRSPGTSYCGVRRTT